MTTVESNAPEKALNKKSISQKECSFCFEKIGGFYLMEDECLSIPVNIPTRMEFYSGFGTKELAITLIVAGIVSAISFIIYKIFGSLSISILTVMITVSATIMSIIKDKNNLCLIDQFSFLFKFLVEQRKYYHEYREVL